MAAVDNAAGVADGGADGAAPARVNFVCERAGSKLRVRITSAGYHRNANCQFPRAIRAAGATYSAPADAVTFARGPSGTLFYRVRPAKIRTESTPEGGAGAGGPVVVYGDDPDDTECNVCLIEEKSVVFIPCGHYCTCATCAAEMDRCPLCRAAVTDRVGRAEID